jgi:hypothetical protein
LRDVAPVENDSRFKGAYCHHHQGDEVQHPRTQPS